ncbi:MAG TPA: transketolase [Acidiferrobacteraceae bacterium]|nr:transketolase [Acidiferrobacteraceae bacterium]
MGDQIGTSVEGQLYLVPADEFKRVLALDIERSVSVAVFANMARLNALYMIAVAGSGHIGSSFSSMDIVSWLLLEELERAGNKKGRVKDVYFSSKGHDAPGYYAALIGAGLMSYDYVNRLRRLGGLPGHPDIHTECMETNTGSLGMGISKAKGMVTANRLLGQSGRVFVMTGDGELQEGQFWESLVSAVNGRFEEITVIVDHNKLQSDTFVSQVSDLGDLEGKLSAFGWHVERVDGHDLSALERTFRRLNGVTGKPRIIIADTVKGRGVSFMEHTAMESDAEMYRFHSGAPDAESYVRAAQELIDTINSQLVSLGEPGISLDVVEKAGGTSQCDDAQYLIKAYSRALVTQAGAHPELVALDADLVLDTGLIPFREKFPKRFIECGIAEQDMVSQAGGMALKGLLPVVHSFACFLSARPNEQIYNNATEYSKIIYVGSLAGVLPGGPGHSHQAVRDIATLAGVPGLTLVEPCTEQEVDEIMDWCVNCNANSSYIRLVSLPWKIPFTLPGDYKVAEGRGAVLTEGNDVILISSGPVMLGEAYRAAEILAESDVGVKVINLPWLNKIDDSWLLEQLRECKALFTLDNHYRVGGQGDVIVSALARAGGINGLVVRQLGIEEVPVCGTNEEVLKAHNLDAQSLANLIKVTMSQGVS